MTWGSLRNEINLRSDWSSIQCSFFVCYGIFCENWLECVAWMYDLCSCKILRVRNFLNLLFKCYVLRNYFGDNSLKCGDICKRLTISTMWLNVEEERSFCQNLLPSPTSLIAGKLPSSCVCIIEDIPMATISRSAHLAARWPSLLFAIHKMSLVILVTENTSNYINRTLSLILCIRQP